MQVPGSGSDGRPLRPDPDALSADPALPAFLSKPPGAPVYHGFPVLESSEVDGFRFGMITDFIAKPDTAGDAFVVAPDNSRAGLVWESECATPYFDEIIAAEDGRWGVWAVGLPNVLRTEADAREFLLALLPQLVPRWNNWRRARPLQ